MTTTHQDTLREAGYKATPGRIALLKLLKTAKEPLSIQEIIKKAEKKLGRVAVDQATVYRMLAVLEKIGAVKQVNLRHGHADYEFVDPKDHHHIICVVCKRVEDLEDIDTPDLSSRALRQATSFAKVTAHSLEFFGICKKCL